MAAFHNDNTTQYGSRTLVIGSGAGGTGGTTYVADSITIERPSKVIQRTNELDEPSGQVLYADFVTGSATVQLASGSTPIPQLGWQFTTTFSTPPGAEIFVVSSVSKPEQKDAEKKVNIGFRKVYQT